MEIVIRLMWKSYDTHIVDIKSAGNDDKARDYFLNNNAMHFESAVHNLSAVGINPIKQLKPPNQNNSPDFNRRNEFIWLRFGRRK